MQVKMTMFFDIHVKDNVWNMLVDAALEDQDRISVRRPLLAALKIKDAPYLPRVPSLNVMAYVGSSFINLQSLASAKRLRLL
jgi:hypothetical protein